MHTERSDIDHLSFSERLVEQQVLVYLSDTTGYIHIQYVRSLNYNPLAIEINFHMVFSGFMYDVVEKESRQFLLNSLCAIMW